MLMYVGMIVIFGALVAAVISYRYYFPSVDIPADGKVIVITGAASGFGLATTRELLKRGSKVVALDINEAQLTKLFENEPNVYTHVCDVTDIDSIATAAAYVEGLGVEVFGLFNNAGIASPPEALMNMSHETMEKVLYTNGFSLFRVTKAFWPMLLKASKNTSPIVVNMTSCAGLMAGPFMGNYAMSKYMGEAFSDSLRRELLPLGIRVAIIEPFFARTSIIDAINEAKNASSDVFYDRIQFAAATVRRMKMMGPEKVALAVVDAIFSSKCRTRTLVAKPLDRMAMWGACYSPARVSDFVLVTLAGLKTRKTTARKQE